MDNNEQYQILKKYEHPNITIEAGVIKTAGEWLDLFRNNKVEFSRKDLDKKLSWFHKIDFNNLLHIDTLPENYLEVKYPKLWYTINNEFRHLSLHERIRICSLAIGNGVCQHCHNENSGCNCWNDQ